jgi:helicase
MSENRLGDRMRNALPINHGLAASIQGAAELLPMIDGVPSLTNAQYEALSAGVARGQNVLVSAPTSTGKTLIGWWTIASAINLGGRAVYLVSHRALAKQKFEEAQRLFLNSHLQDDRASIVCATGDSVEDASGRKTSSPLSATIIIATYEKFLGLMSTGGPPRDLTDTTFICDEVQLIGDKNRGQNVELLLTLLKRSGWRQFVGLSAVLSDGDAKSLSDWLGLYLVRNPGREKALSLECYSPERVLTLESAPDAEATWHESPPKPGYQNTSDIVQQLTSQPGQKPIIVFCMKVDETFQLASKAAALRAPTKTVVIPAGIEIDGNLVELLKRGIAFHNAELSEDERLFVENRLATGDVDTVFSTSTLAAGVNFPLGSAVFASWKRWNFERSRHEPIGRAEFQNMAGRVGRMGQAALKGRVVLSASGGADMQIASHLMDLAAQDDLGSGIKPDDFSSLTLQIFAGKLSASRDEAFDIISSTLSAAREIQRNSAGVAHWRIDLDRQIQRLIYAGCLIESGNRISVTALGEAVARSGLKPETAQYFFEGLSRFGEQLTLLLPEAGDETREDDLAFVLAHAALASPEYGLEGGGATRHVNWRITRPNLLSNDYARRLNHVLFSQPWMGNVGAANGSLLLGKWVSGQTRQQVEGTISSVRLGTIQAMARDVAWILTGVSEIVSTVTAINLADESKPPSLRGTGSAVLAVRKLSRAMRRQATRINMGMPSNVLWMSALDLQERPRRLSRAQMLALRQNGLIRPIDLMNGSPDADNARRVALDAVINPKLANSVRDAAKRWKSEDREHCRKSHARRASKFNAADIIDSLYSARGDQFEAAFADALSFVAIDFVKLDGPGKIGYPDFSVTIENQPPLVFELKTKASDVDVVPLNAATEVLMASELIGMKGNFCVTLCNPGVEPSVPGLIERCGRLCVVDASDFAEAILRVREGALTRDELYNWLTTPGIALREDLPHAR